MYNNSYFHFVPIYTVRGSNSGIVAQSKNVYFARQSGNSYFAKDNSGIVPILTVSRTNMLYREQNTDD